MTDSSPTVWPWPLPRNARLWVGASTKLQKIYYVAQAENILNDWLKNFIDSYGLGGYCLVVVVEFHLEALGYLV